jgi:fluoride exporter
MPAIEERGMNFITCIWVMAGGAIGTLARYLVAAWALPISDRLPIGTIMINVTGSLIIGFIGTLTLAQGKYPLSENLRLFLMVGVCGGYTTFSAFSLQSFDLLRIGAVTRALANIGASIILCLVAVAIGHMLASRLNGGARDVAQLAIEEKA